MDDQHLRLTVKSSFHQYLALLILAAICCTSFLLWSNIDERLLIIKYSLLAFTLCFFVKQLWQLKHWQHTFVINADGQGYFLKSNQRQVRFRVLPHCTITPMMIIFRFEIIDDVQNSNCGLIPIFFDMLTASEYRQLCRTVHLNKA